VVMFNSCGDRSKPMELPLYLHSSCSYYYYCYHHHYYYYSPPGGCYPIALPSLQVVIHILLPECSHQQVYEGDRHHCLMTPHLGGERRKEEEW